MANAVTCSLQLTNQGSDRILAFLFNGNSNGSKAFDNFGNESLARSGRVANRTGDGGRRIGAYYIGATLIGGVPVPATLLVSEYWRISVVSLTDKYSRSSVRKRRVYKLESVALNA